MNLGLIAVLCSCSVREQIEFWRALQPFFLQPGGRIKWKIWHCHQMKTISLETDDNSDIEFLTQEFKQVNNSTTLSGLNPPLQLLLTKPIMMYKKSIDVLLICILPREISWDMGS